MLNSVEIHRFGVSLGKGDLLVAGGTAEVLPVSPICPLPLQRTHPLLISSLLFSFCGGSNQNSIQTAGGNLMSKKKRGGKSQFVIVLVSAESGIWRFCIVSRSLPPISIERMQDLKEPALLMAFMIMLHAKLCLSTVLNCMCWHPERRCRALSSCGRKGQVRRIEHLNHTA